MYEKITDVNAYEEPMMIYPTIHYTMGGIWVDYNLQTTIPAIRYRRSQLLRSRWKPPRCFCSYAGSRRWIFHTSLHNRRLSRGKILDPKIDTNHPAFAEAEKAITERINKLFNVKGKRSVDSFHKELGHIMWEYVGMARNEEGLKKAISEIRKIRKEYWENVCVPGENNEFNMELEKALRVADLWKWEN